eukprot:scaffold22599_cov139-Cylindrotheca_fusiformis.AAC.9
MPSLAEELPPLPASPQTGGEEKLEQTPLKEAADLIQSLDIACAEMNNCAEDAARDAETARKNARAASEIARRYLHRSYPKTQTQFGFGKESTTPPSPNHRPQRPILRINTETKEDSLDDISAIGSELETPTRQSYNKTALERRKAPRTYKTPTSTERIAQSHADDVLGLSIELERAKQALKSEQKMHEQSKKALEASEAKNKELQSQNEKLQATIQKSQLHGSQRTQVLEQELERSNLRLQAAEEDAQLALDLAKDSAEKRDEMEERMEQALDELERLKASVKSPDSSKRSVRFADSATSPRPPPPPPRPTPDSAKAISPHSLTPRSMVAAGRQLLRRSTGTTPEQEVITMELTPAKSAERRRRLQERLLQLDEDGIPTPRRLPATPHPTAPPPPVLQKVIVDDFMGVAKILQESGQRLDLGGHWWRKDSGHANPIQDIHLEAITRQYCQSVEVRAFPMADS